MSNLRPLYVRDVNYFLDIKKQYGKSIINLTDLKNVWQRQFSESEAVQQFKNENSQIRSSDKWMAEYIVNTLSNQNTKIDINIVGSDINICFCSEISNLVETRLNFTLNLQPPEKIFKELTLPLLMIINELQYRQKKLLSIVKSKDVEIKEFKFEGASITRKNAVTQPFNALSFDLECMSSLSNRAEEILKNPTSVINPIGDLYTEFSNIASEADIKKEIVEDAGNSTEDSVKNGKIVEDQSKIDITKKESELELKRKMTEALSRSKRPKKLYKI